MKNFPLIIPHTILLAISFLLCLISCNEPSHIASRHGKGPISPNPSTPNDFTYGAGDILTDAYLDSRGKLWFTTTGEGLYTYDGKGFSKIGKEQGLCSQELWSVIKDDRGNVCFATGKGLCFYDGSKFSLLPLPQEDAKDVSPKTGFPSNKTERILNLIQDSAGNFWLGTDASGAYKYDGRNFTSFLKFAGRLQADSVYNNCITSILEDRRGNIWFTSMTHGGISRYDGKEMKQFAEAEGLEDDMITSSFEDKSGNIWFGSIQNMAGGLLRYDGKTFTRFTKSDGLCDSNVSCFYEDEAGKLWIGTGNGICYFDGESFISFEPEGKSFGDIRFIIKDKEANMWFGGRYGALWRFDGKELKDFTYEKRISAKG